MTSNTDPHLTLKKKTNANLCNTDTSRHDHHSSGWQLRYHVDNIIKIKIENAEGFSKGQECLIFVNKELEDKRMLVDCNILKESTLLLVLFPFPRGKMRIFMRMSHGNTIPIEVVSSDTIYSIKLKVYEKEGTRPIWHLICQKDWIWQETVYRNTLIDYNIQKASIWSHCPVNVSVEMAALRGHGSIQLVFFLSSSDLLLVLSKKVVYCLYY